LWQLAAHAVALLLCMCLLGLGALVCFAMQFYRVANV